MKIRKDGIYKTIDSKDFGLFQQSGWEKVVVEPVAEPKPIIEEVKVEEPEPVIEEMPKAKKKKKV